MLKVFVLPNIVHVMILYKQYFLYICKSSKMTSSTLGYMFVPLQRVSSKPFLNLTEGYLLNNIYK